MENYTERIIELANRMGELFTVELQKELQEEEEIVETIEMKVISEGYTTKDIEKASNYQYDKSMGYVR